MQRTLSGLSQPVARVSPTYDVCVECLPADKPWDVVSATRRSSGVEPRACVRVYARVLVPPNLYIHTYTDRPLPQSVQRTLSGLSRPVAIPGESSGSPSTTYRPFS